MAPHCFSTITISQDTVSPKKKSLKRKRESSDIGNEVCSKRSTLKDITNVSVFLTWIIVFLIKLVNHVKLKIFPDYHNYKISLFSLQKTYDIKCKLNKEDEKSANNLFEAPQYASDIFEYMKQEEKKYLINSSYMKEIQNEITPKMRSVLVDWMTQVIKNSCC